MCRKDLGLFGKHHTRQTLKSWNVDVLPSSFGKKDAICVPCFEEQVLESSEKIIQYDKEHLTRDEFDTHYNTNPLAIKIMEQYLENHPVEKPTPPITPPSSSPMGSSSPTISSNPADNPHTLPIQNVDLSKYISPEQLRLLTKTLHDQYKAHWDKNGVVQIKTPSLAILQRMWGQQVQFIIACDQLTKEGYRLMAIDEGKSGGQSSGGFTGGVNAYFYFQKMDFVR